MYNTGRVIGRYQRGFGGSSKLRRWFETSWRLLVNSADNFVPAKSRMGLLVYHPQYCSSQNESELIRAEWFREQGYLQTVDVRRSSLRQTNHQLANKHCYPGCCPARAKSANSLKGLNKTKQNNTGKFWYSLFFIYSFLFFSSLVLLVPLHCDLRVFLTYDLHTCSLISYSLFIEILSCLL